VQVHYFYFFLKGLELLLIQNITEIYIMNG